MSQSQPADEELRMMLRSRPRTPLVMTQNNAKRPVVLLQVTDTHLHAAADSRMRGVTTHETFLSVLDHARKDTRWPPDAVVVSGDIVQDESRAGYERFRETMKTCGVPIFCLPGNHDDPQLMMDILAEYPFQVCGDATMGGWTLIFLNTFVRGDDGGRLGAAALTALDEVLEAHANHHALICMHHHPLPMGSAWLDGVGLRDAEQFLASIARHDHVRGVLWGHVHQASDRVRNEVRFLSAPSTCSQFLPNSDFFALDTKPPGLRWLTLETDGRIGTEVSWLQGTNLP